MALGQVNLASILGPAVLLAAQEQNGLVSCSGEEISKAALAHVLSVVASLQGRLQENEGTISELQAKSDNIEEKCRSWKRRLERAEGDFADEQKRCDDLESAATQARMDAAPMVERFMEAEVLRSQMHADEEEVKRLEREINMCHEDLAKGWPRVSKTEDLAGQLSQSTADIEAQHTKEVALLRVSHLDEMSELRSQHALHLADIETGRLGNLSDDEITQDLEALRSAQEEARWQGEVYAREQQDAIRESCIKQRENARLAKCHGEARNEALELAVKIEAMRAAEAGAPAREAELHIVRQRCALLQRTASEWREALASKSRECVRWRQRAAQPGGVGAGEIEEAFADLDSAAKASLPRNFLSSIGGTGSRSISAQVPALDWHNMSASVLGSPHQGACAHVPTPTRTSHAAAGYSERSRHPYGLPHQGIYHVSDSPFTNDGNECWEEDSGLPVPGPDFRQQDFSVCESAQEFLDAAVYAAQVWADAEVAGSRASPDSSSLGLALVEAENELEMLTFLLDEGAAFESAALLEQEAQHQTLLVAKRLREHSHELRMRQHIR